MAEPLGRGLRAARRSGQTSPEPVSTPDGPATVPNPRPRARNPRTSRTTGERQDARGRNTPQNSSCSNQAGNDLPELTGGSRLSAYAQYIHSRRIQRQPVKLTPRSAATGDSATGSATQGR